MTTDRIDHTNCSHPRTTAARTACRKARAAEATRRDRGWTPPAETLAIFAADRAARQVITNSLAEVAGEELTITTDAGKIRVGSVIVALVRGGENETYTVLEVSDDIKNGYAGWSATGRWGYADQVVRVVKF